MTTSADGRAYVTQVMGGQVSAFDLSDGTHQLVIPQRDGRDGGDDLVVLSDGSLCITELLGGHVGVYQPDGTYRRLPGDLAQPNGIATDFERRRLFVDEARDGGRLLELDPAGMRQPRVLLQDLPATNGFCMARDGHLYYPVSAQGEIWRYDLRRGKAERVFVDIANPSSVRARPNGSLIVPQADGSVRTCEPATGRSTLLTKLDVGCSSAAVTVDDRIIVSSFLDGSVREVTPGRERILSPRGWSFPRALAVRNDGRLWVADVGLSVVSASGEVRHSLNFFDGVAPMDLAVAGDTLFVLNLAGERYDKTSDILIFKDIERPAVRVRVALDTFASLFALDDHRIGLVDRVNNRLLAMTADGSTTPLAGGLQDPLFACRDQDNHFYVIQRGGTQLIRIPGGNGQPRVIAKFASAQGIACGGDWLFIADIGTREIVALHRKSYVRRVVIEHAPIGSPAYKNRGLNRDFARLCAAPDGVFAAFTGDGSIRHITASS